MDIAGFVKKVLLGMEIIVSLYAVKTNIGVEMLVFVMLKLSKSKLLVFYVDLIQLPIKTKNNVFVIQVIFGAVGNQVV
jgi:hypothetical protein